LFSWILPIGGDLVGVAQDIGKFQSLFSWMLPIGNGGIIGTLNAEEMFQSLFSWMLPIGARTRIFTPRFRQVSILVLLDVAHRPQSLASNVLGNTLFQSLFSWMLPIGHLLDEYPVVGSLFQSLFSWMLPIGISYISHLNFSPRKFQSLFSWMLPIGIFSPLTSFLARCFDLGLLYHFASSWSCLSASCRLISPPGANRTRRNLF
jgi:hypothetical protein